MLKKYIISSLLGAVLIAVAFVNTLSAHAAGPEFHANVIIPVTMRVTAPCLNHGQGDVVTVSGNMHFVQMISDDNSGGFLLNYHFNTQDLTGVSQATGQKYQGIDSEADVINGKVGTTITAEQMWRFIGQRTVLT